MTWWSWPTLLLSAVLSGLLVATYVAVPDGAFPARARSGRLGTVGAFATFFAVGCPVCNKLALIALGEPASAGNEQHLASCARCRSRVDQLAAVVSTARKLVLLASAWTQCGWIRTAETLVPPLPAVAGLVEACVRHDDHTSHNSGYFPNRSMPQRVAWVLDLLERREQVKRGQGSGLATRTVEPVRQ